MARRQGHVVLGIQGDSEQWHSYHLGRRVGQLPWNSGPIPRTVGTAQPSSHYMANSTVSLWRYNFGVVVPITRHNGSGTGEPQGGASSLRGHLVDPIDQARGEVERCQVPIL
jgi:hypothetical protein